MGRLRRQLVPTGLGVVCGYSNNITHFQIHITLPSTSPQMNRGHESSVLSVNSELLSEPDAYMIDDDLIPNYINYR